MRGLVAAVLALLVSAGAAQADLRKEWVEYNHGATKLKSYLVYDDKAAGKRPGGLPGASPQRHGREYAHEHRTVRPTRLRGIRSRYVRLWPGCAAENRAGDDHADRHVLQGPAAHACARRRFRRHAQQSNRRCVAGRLIGYCFGGTVGIELAYAGAPLAATITIHGTFRDHVAAGASNIKGKVLILHGAEDQVSPLVEVNKIVEALRKAKVGFQYELYSGADHGFSTPQTPPRSAPTCSRSPRRRVTSRSCSGGKPRARNRPPCDGRHSGRIVAAQG